MKLKQLEFAVALAEEGSFTRAAARCHVVQSALSHQIARLEDELGAALFQRLPRGLRVTPAGDVLLRHARQVLGGVRQLQAEVAAATGEVRGTLAVGQISAQSRIDLVAALADYHQRHRQVEFQLRTDRSEVLLAQVQARQLDVALVGLPPGDALAGLQHQLIEEEVLVAVLPAGHRLAARRQLPLAALQDEALVDFPAGSGARRQTDDAFAAAGLGHTVRYEVNHMDLVERFIAHGLAIGIVPTSLAAGFTSGVQVALRPAPRRRVHLVWQRQPTPAAQAFVSAVLRRVPAAPAP